MKSQPQHIVFDVDGVLTNGLFYYNEDGKAMKAFACQDSDGIRMLMDRFSISLITADRTGFDISARRAEHMGVPISYVTCEEREAHIRKLSEDGGVIFMGDSVTDIPALRAADYAITPRQARIEVRDEADYVTSYDGGSGAVLDACLHIKSWFKS